jgi:MFS family permease
VIGTLLVARRTVVRLRTAVVGAAAFGASMLALTFVPSVAVAFPVVAVVGAASVAYMTASTALVQLRSDEHMVGRVLALQTVLLVGTTPVGGPLLGLLADAAGARSAVLAGAIGALVAAGLGVLLGRRRLAAGGPADEVEPAETTAA